MAWTKPLKETHPLMRLAQIAMRMNRLRTIREVRRVNSMINLHAPAIRRHPRGQEAIEKTRAHMQRLQAVLQKDVKGEVKDAG